MAVATYGVSLSTGTVGTQLTGLWRYISADLIRGFNAKCEEWNLIQDLEEFDTNFSARTVAAPIDITRQGGGASIAEGGSEADPRTAPPQEIVFTWINENHRFSKSLLSGYLDRRASSSQIEKQMKYQGMKLMEGLCNRVGNQFYGYSTGYVCQTSTNATSASQTLTLINAYGETDLDNAAFLASKFTIGDRIAIIRSGALVTNGIGVITAVTAATPSIAVTMNGSTDVDANDYIVMANSLGNTVIGDTDYNKWVVGLLDGATTTSVHGLSGSTFPLWIGHNSTTGGRYSLSHLRAGQYAIQNNGGGKANLLIASNGVLTDMTLQQQAVLRYEDAMNMEFDGATKVKGARIFTSRKAPNSRVFLLDSKKAVKRWTLMPMPSQDGGYPEGAFNANEDKLQDVSAKVFSLDFSYALAWQNRSCISVSSGLTEA
jgi:hypothetical protein